MLQVESGNKKLDTFTEFEQGILFDIDDPDFDHSITTTTHINIFQMRSSMSLASVHPAEIHSSHSSLMTISHSLDDLASLHLQWPSQEHVLTIEQLRLEMTTCFTCGVSWNDSHVSLDCSECGGYALERPCPKCDDRECGAVWKRDLSLSHSSGKAKWQGECKAESSGVEKNITNPTTITEQEITKRLAKLNANS